MRKMLQVVSAAGAVLLMTAASAPSPTPVGTSVAVAATSRWGEPSTAFMSTCGECATRGCQAKSNWECSPDSKKGTCTDWGPVACVGLLDAPLTLSGTLEAELTAEQVAAVAGMSRVRDCAGGIVRRAYGPTRVEEFRALTRSMRI
jgi:hypothetical protein